MSGTIEVIARLRDKITSPAGKINASFGRMRRQTTALSRDFSRLGGALGHLGAGLAAVMSVKKFADFEQSLANVSTMLDDSSKYMATYKEGIQRMATDIGESVDSLAGGLYDILSASVDPARALDVLAISARAAKAGMSDTKTAADAITTVLNSYGMAAERAGDVSDFLFQIVRRGKTTFGELAPNIGKVSSLAASAGLSLDEFGAAIALLTRNGVKTENALTAVQAVLSTVLKPASEAAAEAKSLGLEMDTTALRTKGLLGILKDMATLPPDTLARLFPNVRALRGVLPALNSLEGFADDIEAMAAKAGATEAAYEKMAATTATGFAKLRQEAEQTARTLGEALAAPAGEAGAAALTLVRDLANAFAGLVAWAQQFAAANPALASSLLGLVSSIGKLIAVAIAFTAAAKGWSILGKINATLGTTRQAVGRTVTSFRALGAASEETQGTMARLRGGMGAVVSGLKRLGATAANIGFAVLVAQIYDLLQSMRKAEAAADDLTKAMAAADWDGQRTGVARLRAEMDALGDSMLVRFNLPAVLRYQAAMDDLNAIEDAVTDKRLTTQRAMLAIIKAGDKAARDAGGAVTFLGARADAAIAAYDKLGDNARALKVATDRSVDGLRTLITEYGVTEEAVLALAKAYDDLSDTEAGEEAGRTAAITALIAERTAIREATKAKDEAAAAAQRLHALQAPVDAKIQEAAKEAAEQRREAVAEIVKAWADAQDAERGLDAKLLQAETQRAAHIADLERQQQTTLRVLETMAPKLAERLATGHVDDAQRLADFATKIGQEGADQVKTYVDEYVRIASAIDNVNVAFAAFNREQAAEQDAARKRSREAAYAFDEQIQAINAALTTDLQAIDAAQKIDRLTAAFDAGEIAATDYARSVAALRLAPLVEEAAHLRSEILATRREGEAITGTSAEAEQRRAEARARVLELTRRLADVERQRAATAAEIDSTRSDAAQEVLQRLTAQRDELRALLQQLDAQVAAGSMSSTEAIAIADEKTQEFQKNLLAARIQLAALLDGDPAAAARLQAQLDALNTGFPQVQTRMQRFATEAQRIATGPLETFFDSMIQDMSDVKSHFKQLLDDMAAAIRRWVVQQAVLKFFSMFTASPGQQAATTGAGMAATAFATGGLVPGPNVNRDVVSALLTPGEYVITRAAVAKYGTGFLEAINAGVAPPPTARVPTPNIGHARNSYNAGGAVTAGDQAPTVLPVQVTDERGLSKLLTGNRSATRRALADLGVVLR